MLLQRFQPHPQLAPHLEALWVFESNIGLSAGHLRTVVPNGRPKLIIPYQGNLVSVINQQSQDHAEAAAIVIGMMTAPAIIDGSGVIGTIGIEFKPASAHRFLAFPLKELTNRVQRLDDLLGQAGRDLQDRLSDIGPVAAKLRRVELFLRQRLADSSCEQNLIDQAVHAIEASAGLIRIDDLSRELGYSKGYLTMKFAEYVGLNPKMLARIVRFQQFYRRWGQQPDLAAFDRDYYEFYYDQAHFIKEFKSFTGYSPGSFGRQHNESAASFTGSRFPFFTIPPVVSML